MKNLLSRTAFALVMISVTLVRCASPSTNADSATIAQKDSTIAALTDSINTLNQQAEEVATSMAAAASETTATKEVTASTSTRDTTHAIPKNIVVKPEHKYLNLVVRGLKSATAPIVVGVYGMKNKFLDEADQMKMYKYTPNGLEFKTQIKDLDYGQFAFALYQDVDNNGKMTKSMIGLPQEPYAFSNNYKPVMRAPKFNECEFTYNASTNTVVVSMIK